MGKKTNTLRDIFVWTYSRGTLPYDIICALILLFVFLTPRSCFIKRPPLGRTASQAGSASIVVK